MKPIKFTPRNSSVPYIVGTAIDTPGKIAVTIDARAVSWLTPAEAKRYARILMRAANAADKEMAAFKRRKARK